MRKLLMIVVFFSILLVSCEQQLYQKIGPAKTRNFPAFEEMEIPRTFIPKPLHVVGLGDSLTEGIGDELKFGGYFGRVTLAMNDWVGVSEVKEVNLAKKGRRSDQLIQQLEDPAVQKELEEADIILFTIGGNDIMKIVKRDLFKLRVKPFYDELKDFEIRLDEIFGIIRALNGDAVIIVGGLYNPFSILTDESMELEDIIADWNETIEVQTVLDGKSCFVSVNDLFYSNENMVYHTDFFHPNAKGYVQMADRYIESIDKCDLYKLSDGNFDM